MLLLHGFTGSAATWRPLAERLHPAPHDRGRPDRPRLRPTRLPTPHATAWNTAWPTCAGAAGRALGLARAAVLGSALGGRVALQLAAAACPSAYRRWCSRAPRQASAAERAARAAADDALAPRSSATGWRRSLRVGATAAMGPPGRAAGRAAPICGAAAPGQPPMRLANSLRGMEAPAARRRYGIACPRWLRPRAAGRLALDEKYTAIAQAMAAALPCAQLAIIAHAGHAIHLERFDVFTQQVITFLATKDSMSR
ncbi:MAG: alpha/beta fold hydrolase [Kouleothrix sp.]